MRRVKRLRCLGGSIVPADLTLLSLCCKCPPGTCHHFLKPSRCSWLALLQTCRRLKPMLFPWTLHTHYWLHVQAAAESSNVDITNTPVPELATMYARAASWHALTVATDHRAASVVREERYYEGQESGGRPVAIGALTDEQVGRLARIKFNISAPAHPTDTGAFEWPGTTRKLEDRTC